MALGQKRQTVAAGNLGAYAPIGGLAKVSEREREFRRLRRKASELETFLAAATQGMALR